MAEKVELFSLQTPKGELVKVQLPNGRIEMEIRWNSNLGASLSRSLNRVQQFVDSEVLRLCDPYVPMDTGILKQSGIMHTVIGSGEVKYRTPYARRWYYREAYFQGAPKRGTYWFERMKNEGGKGAILRGAKEIARSR